MDKYMASQIITGRVEYAQLFLFERWKKYQEGVNQILKENQKEELIQEEMK